MNIFEFEPGQARRTLAVAFLPLSMGVLQACGTEGMPQNTVSEVTDTTLAQSHTSLLVCEGSEQRVELTVQPENTHSVSKLILDYTLANLQSQGANLSLESAELAECAAQIELEVALYPENDGLNTDKISMPADIFMVTP